MNRLLFLGILLLSFLFEQRETFAQALPTATGPGPYIAVGGTYAISQSGYGQHVLGGAGVFVDLHPMRQVGVEAEGRWLQQNQLASMTQTTYLIGPRAQRRIGRFSPYIKTLVGLGYMRFPYNYAQGRYFVVASGGGVDVKVHENLSLRLIDVEYQQWPQFSFGNLSPYGMSFGFSYRIVRPSRYPR